MRRHADDARLEDMLPDHWAAQLCGSQAIIIYGLTEREGDKHFISAAVVSADGVLTNYHKTHLWWTDKGTRHEPKFYQSGDRLVTFNRKGNKCGLMICYGGDFGIATSEFQKLVESGTARLRNDF